jgi:hypothetical protein
MLNWNPRRDSVDRFEIWHDLSWDEPLEQMRQVYTSVLVKRVPHAGAGV